MIEWLLIGTVLVWLIAASIFDIKTKEVPDWLNFSLIAIGLTIFIIKSILEKSYEPILNSLLFVGIFFIIGNIMYYTKQWGGGDAKLLVGIGAILPIYPSILRNFFNPEITINFPITILINLVIVGSVYGLLWTIFLIIKHRSSFSKEFKKINQKKKQLNKLLLILLILGILTSFVVIKENALRTLSSIIFAVPIVINYLMTVTKAVEKTSMYKKISTDKIREGDWIEEKIVIDGKTIYTPKIMGVTNKQIKIIKEYKQEVTIKEGIVFIPVFLISTIISLIYGNIFLLFL